MFNLEMKKSTDIYIHDVFKDLSSSLKYAAFQKRKCKFTLMLILKLKFVHIILSLSNAYVQVCVCVRVCTFLFRNKCNLISRI